LVIFVSFIQGGKYNMLESGDFGAQFDKTFRSGEKFNKADLEEVEMEYLYSDGDRFCFMNTGTYDQEFIIEEQIGESKNFLKENTICSVQLFEGRPIGISLPYFIDLNGDPGDRICFKCPTVYSGR
jgi:translation elongation factor P/translation initiation factor 5A